MQLGYIKGPLREVLNSVGIVLGEDCTSIHSSPPTRGQIIVDAALTPAHFHKLELRPPKGTRRIVNDDDVAKFLFHPWMAAVSKRKLEGSLNKYALAPQEPSHLRGTWRLIFYAELRKHLLCTIPSDYQAIQLELESCHGDAELVIIIVYCSYL